MCRSRIKAIAAACASTVLAGPLSPSAAAATEWGFSGAIPEDGSTATTMTNGQWTLSCNANGATKTVSSVAYSSYSGSDGVLDLAKFDEDTDYTVVSLAVSAFKGRTNLKEIRFSETGLRTIGANAFENCTALTNVVPFLPPTLTSLGGTSFQTCSALASPVLIITNLTVINSSSFARAYGIKQVYASSNLTSIGGAAFKYCMITNFVPLLPPTCTTVGGDAFSNGGILANQCLDARNVTSMGYLAFAGTKIAEVLLNPDITTLGSVFSYCSALTNVTPFLPPGVKTLGAGVFRDCTSLRGDLCITNVTSIPGTAFYKTKITSARLSEQLTAIGDDAFNSCLNLTSVTPFLPDTLKSLGSSPLAYIPCTGRLRIGPDFQKIGNKAFKHNQFEELEMSCGVTNIGGEAFHNCSALTNVFVTRQNCRPRASAGCVIANSFNSGCGKLVSVEIPFTRPLKATAAPFADCTALKRIKFFGPAFVDNGAFGVTGPSAYKYAIYCSKEQDEAGWRALADPGSPSAEERLRDDYPGAATFGTLTRAASGTTNTIIKAWLVWESSPYDSGGTLFFVR